MEMIHEAESYKILGGCFEVYKEKGCGFTEAIYQECLELEFSMQLIPFRAQESLPMRYKDHPLKQRFQPDFVCYDLVIVEIKAVSMLLDEHRAQFHNYLKATGLRLGLLVNFAHYPKLQYERIVR